jgi:hypothetical protein
MTRFQRRLLTEMLGLQSDGAAEESGKHPPLWAQTFKERYRLAGQGIQRRRRREHGPRIAELYLGLGADGYDEAARKRVSRALTRLEAEGLVELWGDGPNRTHVKLTEAGRAAVGAA